MFKAKNNFYITKNVVLKFYNKKFGMGTIHHKYIIIGAGYAGLNLAKKLNSVNSIIT